MIVTTSELLSALRAATPAEMEEIRRLLGIGEVVTRQEIRAGENMPRYEGKR